MENLDDGRMSATEFIDLLEAKILTDGDVPPTQAVRLLLMRQALIDGDMTTGEISKLVKLFPSQVRLTWCPLARLRNKSPESDRRV